MRVALGILAAAVVVGVAVTVGYGLSTGFERAAREADLPSVIARFDDEDVRTIDAARIPNRTLMRRPAGRPPAAAHGPRSRSPPARG